MEPSTSPATFDEKDVKILLTLIKDARTPLSSLAADVELSVTATSQRIAKLEENGTIKSYKLVLNHRAFPYEEFDIYYVLTNVSEFSIKNAMKYLSQCPFTTQVLSTMGYSDIRVTMLANNMQHLNEILGEAERNFSANIKTRTILVVTKKYKSKPGSFLSALFKQSIGSTKEKLGQVYEQTEVKLDNTDRTLIKELAKDPRASYASLASLVKLTPEAVSNRVKQLEKQGVILGYTALLDGPKLGYRWAVLLFNMRHMSEQEKGKMLTYIQQHDYLSSAVETLGAYNLTVTIFGNSIDQLHKTELDFRSQFGEHVTDTALLFILENEKYPDIAEGILEDH